MAKEKKGRYNMVLDVTLINKIDDRIKFINNSRTNGFKDVNRSQFINEFLKIKLVDPLEELLIKEAQAELNKICTQREIAQIRFNRQIWKESFYEKYVADLNKREQIIRKFLDSEEVLEDGAI